MIPLTKSLTPAEYQAITKPKRSKYNVGAKEDRTYGGRCYASKLEAAYAQQLDVWKLAGAVREWQPQIPFVLHAFSVSGGLKTVLGRYVVDFRIIWSTGRLEYIECKGVDLALGKWKRAHCEAEHQIKITVVKKIA